MHPTDHNLCKLMWRRQRWPGHDLEFKDTLNWKRNSQPTILDIQQNLDIQNPTWDRPPHLLLPQLPAPISVNNIKNLPAAEATSLVDNNLDSPVFLRGPPESDRNFQNREPKLTFHFFFKLSLPGIHYSNIRGAAGYSSGIGGGSRMIKGEREILFLISPSFTKFRGCYIWVFFLFLRK